jgi:Na+/melibiose symporter-like transporter
VGVFTVFFDVAYQSYLPSLVDRADLVEGNAKLEVSQSAAQVAGRALAGFLIRVIGAAKAIAVDAGAFLTSAVVLLSIKKAEPRQSPRSSDSDPSFLAELKEGAQVVFKNPILMRIAACTATSDLGGSIALTVFLIFAYNQLKLTPEIVGIIFAVGSVGLLIGALVAAKVAKGLGLGWALAIAIIVGGVAVLGMPLALVASPILVPAILQAFGGFWLVLYNIN